MISVRPALSRATAVQAAWRAALFLLLAALSMATQAHQGADHRPAADAAAPGAAAPRSNCRAGSG